MTVFAPSPFNRRSAGGRSLRGAHKRGLALKKKLLAAALLAIVPLGAANAMDVATFLGKADALQKKGMMALMSSDYKLLKSEIQTNGAACGPSAWPPSVPARSRLLSARQAEPHQQRGPCRLPHHPRGATAANPGQGRASALMARKYPCRG
jgi:hypothetical protein